MRSFCQQVAIPNRPVDLAPGLADYVTGLGADYGVRLCDLDLDAAAFAGLAFLLGVITDRVLPPQFLGDAREGGLEI